ncbi:MAG: hypothetical protein ACI9P7_000774 [Candidatus Azotimanducaceae bacterium]
MNHQSAIAMVSGASSSGIDPAETDDDGKA